MGLISDRFPKKGAGRKSLVLAAVLIVLIVLSLFLAAEYIGMVKQKEKYRIDLVYGIVQAADIYEGMAESVQKLTAEIEEMDSAESAMRCTHLLEECGSMENYMPRYGKQIYDLISLLGCDRGSVLEYAKMETAERLNAFAAYYRTPLLLLKEIICDEALSQQYLETYLKMLSNLAGADAKAFDALAWLTVRSAEEHLPLLREEAYADMREKLTEREIKDWLEPFYETVFEQFLQCETEAAFARRAFGEFLTGFAQAENAGELEAEFERYYASAGESD